MNRVLHPRVLVLVLLLPVLVAGVGMWALDGRVDRLDSVPAAVVNLDEGAEMEVDGETQTVPLGRSVAGALTQPDTAGDSAQVPGGGEAGLDGAGFDWRLTDEDDAFEGLRDGTYAAVIVIPEDFSENLVTIGTTDAVPAIIEVTTNDANGQLNALIGTAVTQAAATGLGGEMTQQYLDGLYVGFGDLKDGYQEAADGAGELADGTDELADGTDDLADGASELADGADSAAEGTREFSGGVYSLADGARQTADGTGELATGLDQLADGTSSAADGSGELATGLDQLADGTEELAGGTGDLADGLDELATGAEDLADGTEQLSAGLRGTEDSPGLLDGTAQLRAGVEGDGTAENPGLEAGADQLADALEQYADGVAQASEAVTGDGTAENPGLAATADGLSAGAEEAGQGAQDLADGTAVLAAGLAGDGTAANPGMTALAESMTSDACALAASYPDDETAQRLCEQSQGMQGYTGAVDGALNGTDGSDGLVVGSQQLADGVNGTDAQPGLVDGIEGVQAYADGLETAFAGDGTAENPGLVAASEQLAEGARSSADGSGQLVEGVVALDDGLTAYADGVDDLADGAGQLAEGTRDAADGAAELAEGTGSLAEGARDSADGASGLATGLDDLAEGGRASADGAGQLADGSAQLADGADELATASGDLADGVTDLAEGTGQLADGTGELADGTGELADGSRELADGLEDGAEQVPSYSEDERDRMAEMAAAPVDTETQREHEADGASTAIFPFVLGLALWLGAFAGALLLPALSRRLLDRALPMWRVVLGSLLPALGVAAAQAVAVLAVITAVGISPVSPLAVGLVALAGAGLFAMIHQALMILCGTRTGRLLSVLLLVLQVVALVGILPLQTAPPALAAIAGYMPLTIVTEGLVHAAVGGALVSTAGTLGGIAVWALVALALSLLGARTARRADRGGARTSAGAEAAAA